MRTFALCILSSLSACGAASPEPRAVERRETVAFETRGECEGGAGAWSEAVDGLRGRVVFSDTEPHLVIELENVSAQPIALHWDGSPSVGFATFALRDGAGNEPMPDWAFGGNEMTGSLALVLPAGARNTRDAMASFSTGLAGETRVLRIGAFWGRALPDDGSPRYLSARVVSRAPGAGDTTEDGSAITGATPWTSALELPAVCID
jgi:hypothetical protein